MTELGLDVPSTWGGGSSTILSRIAALAVIAEKYGSKVTIAEVLGAGSKTDLLVVGGGIYASFWLGAAIGSAAVATGEYTSCGTTISDAFHLSAINGIHSQDIRWVLTTRPEIVDLNSKTRHGYAALAWALSS